MGNSPGVRLALPAVYHSIPQELSVVDQTGQDPEGLEVEVEMEDRELVLVVEEEEVVLEKR